MFISKKKYEQDLRDAAEKAAGEALREIGKRNSLDDRFTRLERRVDNSLDRLNERLSNLEKLHGFHSHTNQVPVNRY